MTKSELIERLATQQSHIPAKTVEDAVKEMLEHMASTLAQNCAIAPIFTVKFLLKLEREKSTCRVLFSFL